MNRRPDPRRAYQWETAMPWHTVGDGIQLPDMRKRTAEARRVLRRVKVLHEIDCLLNTKMTTETWMGFRWIQDESTKPH